MYEKSRAAHTIETSAVRAGGWERAPAEDGLPRRFLRHAAAAVPQLALAIGEYSMAFMGGARYVLAVM